MVQLHPNNCGLHCRASTAAAAAAAVGAHDHPVDELAPSARTPSLFSGHPDYCYAAAATVGALTKERHASCSAVHYAPAANNLLCAAWH
jgi:hypothetical protein